MIALNSYSFLLRKEGYYPESLKYAKQSFERLREIISDEKFIKSAGKFEIEITVQNYAEALLVMNEFDKALNLAALRFNIAFKNLGEDDIRTVAAEHDLGLAFRVAGDYKNAIRVLKHVKAIYETRLGYDAPSTLLAGQNLALALSFNGESKKAVALTRQILDIRKENGNENDPDTILTIGDLSKYLYEIDELDEALKYAEESLEKGKKLFKDTSPQITNFLLNKAVILAAMEREKEFLALKEEVVRRYELRYDNENLDSIAAKYKIAVGYFRLNRFNEAIELIKEVLGVRKKILGENHPLTLKTQGFLKYLESQTCDKDK